MGKTKHGKKQRHQQNPNARQRYSHFTINGDEQNSTFNDSYNVEQDEEDKNDDDKEEDQVGSPQNHLLSCCSNHDIIPSKFSLYQQSVQSPKGDISYLQKFFLMYVGGRMPLHLQEDFCGTALLSTEWLRTDARRTAVGVDLDLEALTWCMENNVDEVGDGNSSRISLFHGNVLQPHEARLVKSNNDLIQKVTLKDSTDIPQEIPDDPSLISANGGIMKRDVPLPARDIVCARDVPLPARDIVCAFNYSCCCLHNRKELVSYFEHAHGTLSRKGGLFVMDLYGGSSSEREIKLQRKFPNFTYTWEQAEFDVIHRMTRISLHYQLHKPQKKIRNAFSYSWRLWSLPELRDCLEEAGFRAVHFWIREMPDTKENQRTHGFGTSRDDKYEEVTIFRQQDAWNAYVVAVA